MVRLYAWVKIGECPADDFVFLFVGEEARGGVVAISRAHSRPPPYDSDRGGALIVVFGHRIWNWMIDVVGSNSRTQTRFFQNAQRRS